jgi:hypothetical protein
MKKATEFTIRKFFADKTSKNYLTIKENNKIIILTLKLESHNKHRLIGTVTKSTRTIEMRRKRDIHLFRKGNAYGFNDYVLRNQTSFDWIRLNDETNHWKVPVKFILDNGTYLNFSEQGFELQRFVSLEQLEQFRVIDSENRRF